MTGIQDLPQELLSHIFSFMNHGWAPETTLTSVALVCKDWTTPAQKALWKARICFVPEYDDTSYAVVAEEFLDSESPKFQTRDVTLKGFNDGDQELVRELLANCWGTARLRVEAFGDENAYARDENTLEEDTFGVDTLDASVLQVEALKGVQCPRLLEF